MTYTPVTGTSASLAQGQACSWPVSFVGCSSTEAFDVLPPEDQARVLSLAADFLWNWTDKAFGLCEVTIRPCRVECTYSEPLVDWRLLRSPSRWVLGSGHMSGNVLCGKCGSTCTCGPSSPALVLPTPVSSIESVVIDGEELPATSYRLEGGRRLVRQDGEGWPTCQDLALLPGVPGTWSVTLLVGTPVPEGGQIAAGILAVEFAKAMRGDKGCALPKNWQSITRQGVSISAQDMESYDEGRTGIWLVDSWIASVKAPKPRFGARVYSVDLHHPRR